MPIIWTIDHATRLVSGTVDGHIDLPSLESYVEGVTAAGGKSYPKLFDLRAAEVALTDDDIAVMAQAVTRLAERGTIGPVAIVATDALSIRLAELFDDQTRLRRPCEIFADPAEARWWLAMNEMFTR